MLVINWVINPSEKGVWIVAVSQEHKVSPGLSVDIPSPGTKLFMTLGLPVDFYELNSYGYAAQVFPLRRAKSIHFDLELTFPHQVPNFSCPWDSSG